MERGPYGSVLLTGGAGFIGSHLAESLLADGVQVTILDDLSTGQWSNLAHLEADRNLRVIVASADDSALLEHEVPRHEFVFHLASAVGVRLIIQQPVRTVESIVQTAHAVFSACARYRRPVLLTSTSEVYGKSTQLPFAEDADVVMGPTETRRWAYACAKALDEFLALAYWHESRLPIYIVRLFNTVGPRQTGQYGMVLPTFVAQALSGADVTVFGDGQQKRCFCSVFDVVAGLKRLSRCTAAQGQVVNLGNDEEVSIEQLAQRVIEHTQSTSRIVHVPYAEAYGDGFDDMRSRRPDLTRARKLIGWEPRHNLDEIIAQVTAERQRR